MEDKDKLQEIPLFIEQFQRVYQEFRCFHIMKTSEAPHENDDIIFREYKRGFDIPTGRIIKARVLDVLQSPSMLPGYCIVSFLPYFPVGVFTVQNSTFIAMYDMYLEKCRECEKLREEV